MIGKVFIGRTVMGWPSANWSMRLLHMSAGRPLTSALHEPHLAALQFQRTARSGARWPWIQWMASSATMPVSIGTLYSTSRPPAGSRRRARSSHLLLLLLEQRLELSGHLGERRRRDLHRVTARAHAHVDLAERRIRRGEVEPRVGAAALLAQQGRAGDGLGDGEHVAQVAAHVPAGV